MFGALLLPTPPLTPAVPPPLSPIPWPSALWDAMAFLQSMDLRFDTSQVSSGLSQRTCQSSNSCHCYGSCITWDNGKRVLGGVIFTHPPSLVGANLLVNTHPQLLNSFNMCLRPNVRGNLTSQRHSAKLWLSTHTNSKLTLPPSKG